MRLSKERLSEILAADPSEHILLTCNEVAAILRVSPATVYRWRNNNLGPPYIAVGGETRYFRDELMDWLRSGEAGKARSAPNHKIAAGE